MDKTERKDVKVLKGFAELVPVHVAVNACCGLPFHHKVSITLPDGAGAGSDNLSLPLGKRLVIEFATISAFVPLGSGQKPFVVFQTTAGGVSLLHYLGAATPMGTPVVGNPTDWFVASQKVRVYAEPGINVISVGRTGSVTGESIIDVSISGYLVNFP